MKMLYSHFATKSYVKALYKEGESYEPIAYAYVYNYTDHLGNIRLSYAYDKETDKTKTLEENHYYPFGLKHKNYNTSEYDIVLNELQASGASQEEIEKIMIDKFGAYNAGTGYNYKYNGKELQDVPIAIGIGLDWYDYGARNYDASLGRWMNIDPLADFKPDMTPYRYSYNNPIAFTDPTGLYEIGHISLTKDEKRKLKNKYKYDKDGNKIKGWRKKYKNAKSALREEKRNVIRTAIANLKDMIDNDANLSQVFQDFSGIDSNSTQWDNLWTENGEGPTIQMWNMGEKKGTTGIRNINLSTSMSQGEIMGTIIHEYIHVGDRMRKAPYDITENGLPNSKYPAAEQRNAIMHSVKYSLQLPNTKYTMDGWRGGYPTLFNKINKPIKVELGYAFERFAFGHTLASPADYQQAFTRYLNSN